jgi:hypothetical protein
MSETLVKQKKPDFAAVHAAVMERIRNLTAEEIREMLAEIPDEEPPSRLDRSHTARPRRGRNGRPRGEGAAGRSHDSQ